MRILPNPNTTKSKINPKSKIPNYICWDFEFGIYLVVLVIFGFWISGGCVA